MATEPLNTPMGKVYLYPKTELIVNCAIGLKNPIDVDALKKAFSTSIMLKHPRFCSLMVKDHNGNILGWKIVQINIDEHLIVHHAPATKTRLENNHEEEEVVEAEINAFLADISVSTPLSVNKPLWEVHVLMGLKCVVFRMHHALGDGASMMAMLNACFGENNGSSGHNTTNNLNTSNNTHSKKTSWKEKIKQMWGLIKALWLTLVFGLRLLGRLVWVKDKQSVFSGGDGVELWPRKLVTAKFKLEDFKCVKKAIPSATINDVLLGAISSGMSKYLETKSPDTPQGLDHTATVTVDLRKDAGLQVMSNLVRSSPNSSSWGNKSGSILASIRCYNGLHPLEHVKSMKAIMDQKKKSYEAHLPYILIVLFSSWFGSKVASWCGHRVGCHTSLLISNIVGPSKELVIGDNPVTFLRVNMSSLSHALTIHLVSYKGNADLQLIVAKDIIHDPEFLASCIQGSLDQMKNCIDQ